MDGDLIPESDYVLRHCKSTWINEDGEVTSAAFKLRISEDHLSVLWKEFYPAPTDNQLAQIRLELSSYRDVKNSHKLACLNVGRSVNHVKTKSNDKRVLIFQHKPRGDDSHSGIFNLEPDGAIIAELLVESIIAIYPAK